MALATIDRVKAAEKAAMDRQSATEAQAAGIVDEAHAKAADILSNAESTASARFDERTKAAHKLAADRIEQIRKDALTSAAALREKTIRKQGIIDMLLKETLTK